MTDQNRFKNTARWVIRNFHRNTFFILGDQVCFQTPLESEDAQAHLWSRSAVDTDDYNCVALIRAFSRILKLYKTYRALVEFSNGFFNSNNINRSDEHQAQYVTRWVIDGFSDALESLRKPVCKMALHLSRLPTMTKSLKSCML